jgi:hypothetical protein
MNHSRSNDSEIGSEGCPSKPISTLADLQVKAYEDRVRERLMANIRRVRRPKPNDWRNRSRNLFRFTLKEEFSCGAIRRTASAKITVHKEKSKRERLISLMNGNNPQPKVPSLKELYGAKQSSLPWEEQQAEIVRFWTDSGDCWGFLFHHVSGTYYSAREERLLIDWALGTIVVTGPKTLEFYEQFSNHRATLLRADGKNRGFAGDLAPNRGVKNSKMRKSG